MPAPEHGGYQSQQPDQPYYRVAQFDSEQRAGQVYFRAQLTILEHDCDLSAFRLLLAQRWHVAVLGVPPPDALERELQLILAVGEPATLPDQVVQLLQERRAQAIQEGPWVERHWRPGQPL